MTLTQDLSNFNKIRDEECNKSTLQAMGLICRRNLWVVLVMLVVVVIILILIIKSTGKSTGKSTASTAESPQPSITQIDVEPIE